MSDPGKKNFLSTTLKGIAMGAADVVPGVSGGTIALITGIYEKLIGSINAVDHKLIKLFREKGFQATWNRINGTFLLSLFIGIAISVISLAKLITYLLETYPIGVWAFFFGLILASVLFVGKKVKQWSPGAILAGIAGAAIAFYVTSLPPLAGKQETWFIFVSGMIAICAMILPGVSGSFILLILGSYEFILSAIKDVKLWVIAIFGGGCIVGIITFSKLLNWMFQRYHDITVALMTGFLLGSLNKVWPWKEVVEYKVIDGERKPLIEENILPWDFKTITGSDPKTLIALGLALIAVILVVLMERSAGKEKRY